MILFYRFFINLIFIISPLIILIRLIKKKESLKRFKEKLGFFTKNLLLAVLFFFRQGFLLTNNGETQKSHCLQHTI